MNKKSFFISVTLIVMSLMSCQQSEELIRSNTKLQNPKEENLIIPYATNEVLNKYRTNNALVDYEFSRKAALFEMNSFTDEFYKISTSHSFTLSEKPVIIYDEDGLPKFYEFIVLDGSNKPVATITTFAKKEVMDFTACVLPFIRDYSTSNALKYSSNYPYEENNIISTRVISKKEIQKLPDIDSPDKIASFWKNIDLKMEDIIRLEDKDFLMKYSTPTFRKTKYYIIPKFNNDKLKRTRFSGWCGPAAMAWVYRGLYTTYKGQYIPLHSERATSDYPIIFDPSNNVSYYDGDDIQIYKDFEKESRTLEGHIKGATLPDDFDSTVAKLFPDYKIDRHKGAIKGAPRRSIQRGNPVYMVVFVSGGALHYIVGFGTKDRYGWFGIHTDSWIYVTDNGTNIKSHGYLPYYRSSNFFNFSNKYTHMGEFIRK